MVSFSGSQRGIVLLLCLFLTIGIGVTLFFLSWNSSRAHQERDQKTEQALQQAKEALISHALVYGEIHRTNADPILETVADDITLPPGTLPCPEKSLLSIHSEGAQSGTCDSRDVSSLGRFPWRSLDTGPLRDANGECLWYAVSGSFKANPSPRLLNWDSPGAFEIRNGQGAVIETDVVAVIFSPGNPLAGQNRSPLPGTSQCGGNYTASAYLDAARLGNTDYNNAVINPVPDGKTVFIAGPVRGASGEIIANDRLITITRDELFARAIERRPDFATHLFDPADVNGNDVSKYGLAQKLAACLARYGRNNEDINDRRLPWASPLEVADFDNDSFDDKTGQYAGRPPYRVGSSRASTKNALVPAGCSSESDNCRLLIIERCLDGWWRLAGKPLDSKGDSKKQSPEGWWDKWKDHFFYIVSPEFSPKSGNNWASNPNPCTPNSDCITVGTKRYAAVVAFSGKARDGQQRITLADRHNVANYLDDSNTLAFSTPTISRARSLALAGNDQLVCINPDLTIDSTCH
jgi:type II secretory pathway pseudopilin PulG